MTRAVWYAITGRLKPLWRTPPCAVLGVAATGERVELLYRADRRLRRVALGAALERIWEKKLDLERDEVLGRAGSALLCRRHDHLVALRATTGEEKWRLGLAAPLAEPAVVLPDGDVLLVFADQRWIRAQATNGKRLDGGTLAGGHRHLGELRRAAQPLAGTAGARYLVDDAEIVAGEHTAEIRLAAGRVLAIAADGAVAETRADAAPVARGQL